MKTTKVRKIGNSLGVILPRKMLQQVGIGPDDLVEIEVVGKTLRIWKAVPEQPPQVVENTPLTPRPNLF